MPLGWMEMETEWLRVMGGSWAVGLWRALVPGATSSLCLGRPTGSLGLQTSVLSPRPSSVLSGSTLLGPSSRPLYTYSCSSEGPRLGLG